MKPSSYIILFVMLSCSACNWSSNVEEGDKGTFTWKGQLVKDCNEEPMANEDIYIEIALNGLNQDGAQDTREIARTKTDNNGYFSITYEKIKSLRVMALALRLDDGTAFGQHILSGPINENVNRNIAKNSCDLIYLDFKNISNADSLYINLGKVIDSEYSISVNCEEAYTGCTRRVQAIEVLGHDFNHLFLREGYGSTWDNKPITMHYGAATKYDSIRTSILSNIVDSIPDGFMQFEYKCHGYPIIDTIHIEL